MIKQTDLLQVEIKFGEYVGAILHMSSWFNLKVKDEARYRLLQERLRSCQEVRTKLLEEDPLSKNFAIKLLFEQLENDTYDNYLGLIQEIVECVSKICENKLFLKAFADSFLSTSEDFRELIEQMRSEEEVPHETRTEQIQELVRKCQNTEDELLSRIIHAFTDCDREIMSLLIERSYLAAWQNFLLHKLRKFKLSQHYPLTSIDCAFRLNYAGAQARESKFLAEWLRWTNQNARGFFSKLLLEMMGLLGEENNSASVISKLRAENSDIGASIAMILKSHNASQALVISSVRVSSDVLYYYPLAYDIYNSVNKLIGQKLPKSYKVIFSFLAAAVFELMEYRVFGSGTAFVNLSFHLSARVITRVINGILDFCFDKARRHHFGFDRDGLVRGLPAEAELRTVLSLPLCLFMQVISSMRINWPILQGMGIRFLSHVGCEMLANRVLSAKPQEVCEEKSAKGAKALSYVETPVACNKDLVPASAGSAADVQPPETTHHFVAHQQALNYKMLFLRLLLTFFNLLMQFLIDILLRRMNARLTIVANGSTFFPNSTAPPATVPSPAAEAQPVPSLR